MAKEDLLSKLETYKKAIDSAMIHIIITDTEGKILYANQSVTKITEFSPEELIGETPRLWGKQMPEKFYSEMWDTIKNKKQPFEGELINRRKNGERDYALAVISPIIDNITGELIGFIGTEEDITSLRETQLKLQEENEELEKMNEYMVDRELKMVKLKEELDSLKIKLNSK